MLPACASITRKELRTPGEGGPAWHELRTAHCQLRTDWSLDDAREMAVELERTYVALEWLQSKLFGAPSTTSRPVSVVAFERRDTFHAVTGLPEEVGGRTHHDPNGDSVISIHGRESDRVAHELSHVFIRHNLWWTPVWLNEGLAGYLSSIELWPKSIVIGRTGASGGPRLATGQSLANLMAADVHAFYDARNRRAYYSVASSFVHLLANDDPALRARFLRYLALLRQGTVGAWDTAFSGVTLDSLSERLREYCTWKHACRTWEMPYEAPAVAIDHERTLDDVDVRLLWIELADWEEPRTKVWIADQLAKARVRKPDSPMVLFWAAALDRDQGRVAEARRLLERATQVDPNAVQAWRALAELDTASEPTPALLRLAQIAETPGVLAFVARRFGDLSRPDDGLPYAERALAMAPGCWSCLDAMAFLLSAKGRADEAVEKERLAAALVPETDAATRALYQARLADYAKAAQRH